MNGALLGQDPALAGAALGVGAVAALFLPWLRLWTIEARTDEDWPTVIAWQVRGRRRGREGVVIAAAAIREGDFARPIFGWTPLPPRPQWR